MKLLLGLGLLFSVTAMAQSNNLQDASRIGRTSGAKAPEFQALYDYEAHPVSLIQATFPYYSILHKAYVTMLAEQHIISNKERDTILHGLETVDRMAQDSPALQVYLPYEAALMKIVGPVGGKMHTGRSRNDMDNTVNRMYLRDQLLQIIAGAIELRTSLINMSKQQLNTVMVVYTHRKEAQPVTLAHYLMAVDEAIGKSVERYMQLYKRIDQCPLGAGASGGTSWPINRERVAALLGFQGVVTNTIEGTAGWDHIAEFAADNAIYMSELSRLASEIQLWSTDEYNVVELDNSFAGISSMMPQKKNPDALERTRKAAAVSTGQLMEILTSLNGIEYQHSGVRTMLEPRSLQAVLAGTHTMTGVMRTLHINKERMLNYAKENFSTMTDLADLLVQQAGLDFRDAHEVIAKVVVKALEQGLTADKMTVKMIQEATKHQINITDQQLQTALDPVQSVAHKAGTGMPAPAAVAKMISVQQQVVDSSKVWLQQQRSILKI